jgi:serine/threonine protein kinase
MSPNWVETQELLTATFEQPAGERERFVREHCVDTVLRDTIAALVKPSATIGAPATAGDGTPDLPGGSSVGPYVIVHRLGRGGMGEVFLGRDPRLDRSVALKCLLTSRGGSEDLRARVIREARAAARITHTNVAAVYDVVEHDGRAFIVMEYVEGESLAVLLKRGPLPPVRVIAIGRQIAAALAAAHGGGIVHRDLKPANIQVMPDGSIKILDFGIATALASLTTTTRTTVGMTDTRGQQAGTPAYMSPEQLLGQPVDERSDLFSLALILFEMATGRRLFPSNDPLAVLLASVRTLPRADGIDSTVPSQLADVIGKGLAADPADRFQSATEMGAALDAVREELYSTTSGRDHPRAIERPPRTNRIGRALLLTAVTPIVLWMLGRVSSAAFNTTLGLNGAFASEPVLQPLVWGVNSVVAPCVYAGLAVTAVWAARFVLGLLALFPPGAHIIDAIRRQWRALALRLNLDDPVVLAQALAVLGATAIALVAWRFNGLIRAWGATLSVASNDQIWRLGPANENEKVLYRAVLTVLFLAFAGGLVRVIHLRARFGSRHGAGALAALAVIVASLLLLNEAPYRILWKNSAERVEYQGARCYVVGQDAARWLLFCPDSGPPRNRVVDRGDPAVRKSGVIENIFTLPPTR